MFVLLACLSCLLFTCSASFLSRIAPFFHLPFYRRLFTQLSGWSPYGKPALALDLMEEFRPLIVDSVVLSLLNNRQLEQKDFELELNSCRMADATKRLFLEKFEERMQELITHPTFQYKVPYRRCIELQARLLGKYLTGEVDEYMPFGVR